MSFVVFGAAFFCRYLLSLSLTLGMVRCFTTYFHSHFALDWLSSNSHCHLRRCCRLFSSRCSAPKHHSLSFHSRDNQELLDKEIEYELLYETNLSREDQNRKAVSWLFIETRAREREREHRSLFVRATLFTFIYLACLRLYISTNIFVGYSQQFLSSTWLFPAL